VFSSLGDDGNWSAGWAGGLEAFDSFTLLVIVAVDGGGSGGMGHDDDGVFLGGRLDFEGEGELLHVESEVEVTGDTDTQTMVGGDGRGRSRKRANGCSLEP